jgi:hypothetical protein
MFCRVAKLGYTSNPSLNIWTCHRLEVTHEEYENGLHYSLVEDRLADAGYEEPFVHFDEAEAPAFLHPAVRQCLNVPDSPVIVAQN